MIKSALALGAVLATLIAQPVSAASLPLGNFGEITIENTYFNNITVESFYGRSSGGIMYESSSNPDYFSPYDPSKVLFADQIQNFEMYSPGSALVGAESFTLKVAAQHFQNPENFIANSDFTSIRAIAGLRDVFSVTGGADELRLDFKIDGGIANYTGLLKEYYGLDWDPSALFYLGVTSENGVRVESAPYKDDMMIFKDDYYDSYAAINLGYGVANDGSSSFINDAIISFYIKLVDSKAEAIISANSLATYGVSNFFDTAELVGAVALANGAVINDAKIVGEFTGSLSKYTDQNEIPSPGTLLLIIPGFLFAILKISSNKRRI